MGNCISKINNDHSFVFEEKMKNDIFFLKGKTRSDLKLGARGKTYTGFHSIRTFSEIMMLAPLQIGVWLRDL